MNSKKAFFVSFFVSMLVVLAGFGILYMMIDTGTQETDTPQKGVPVTAPGVEDSKTILLCTGNEYHYFFVFKFDALQNKIGIGAISPSYEFYDGYSLADSLEKAGIMQCVLDIKEYFGVDVDYYLQCSWSQLGRLTEDLTEFGIEELGQGLPQGIREYLLKGAEKLDGKSLADAAVRAEGLLDNRLGLGFMNEAAWCMIKYNIEKLSRECSQVLKDNYSNVVTNINTQRINRLDRIIKFLAVSHVEYPREVIVNGDEQRKQRMENVTD